jgi:hypothetical protein
MEQLQKNYFRALAECMMQTKRPMSVLDFGNSYGYLRKRILEEGKIIAMSDKALEALD